MLKNTLGVNIDRPAGRSRQFVKHSLDTGRLGAEDELPLMLAGNAMRKGGRWTHQIYFDVQTPGMARQRIGKLVRFDGALIVCRSPHDIPYQPREGWIAMLAAEHDLFFEERAEVVL